jgi:hypothetical protein
MATKFRSSRIILWLVFILMCIAITNHLMTTRFNASLNPELPHYWIGLPKFGMDASDVRLRSVLAKAIGKIDEISDEKPLVMSCGMHDMAATETYVITRPTIVWGDRSKAGSQITFEVFGEQVKITKWTLPIPSPPQMGIDTKNVVTKNNQAETVIKRQFFIATKSSLDDFAKQWKTSLVWNSKQSEVDCLDGFGVKLEACIIGQYGIRDGVCAENGMELADAADAALATSGFK